MLLQGTLETLADDRYYFFLVLSYCKVRKESTVKISSHFLLESAVRVSSHHSLHHYAANNILARLLGFF